MSLVTLLDGGRQVSTDSEDWRTECLRRFNEILLMRQMSVCQRVEHLERIEETSGLEARQRLEIAFIRDWKARRAAAAEESTR